VNDINAKRRYSEPTKDAWIIRCMAAENTVKAQDIELTAVWQARAKDESAARELAGENIRLRARVAQLTTAASVLAVLVIVLAGVLIGGAR
jgi:negative regulator of sigma E activity